MLDHPFLWHGIVGNAGVALIVGCYFFIQVGWLKSGDLAYSAGNLIGATLVMISLSQEFNIAAFVLEAFWFLISCYGVVAWIRARAL
jgi:hypothetical protein